MYSHTTSKQDSTPNFRRQFWQDERDGLHESKPFAPVQSNWLAVHSPQWENRVESALARVDSREAFQS